MAKEYRLVVNDDGSWDILNLDGTEMGFLEKWPIRKSIQAVVEPKDQLIYVALGQEENAGLHKIGTTNNVRRRSRELNVCMVHEIHCKRSQAFAIEKSLHALARHWHQRGEWFDFRDPDGKTLLKKLYSIRTDTGLIELCSYFLPFYGFRA